MKKPILIFYFVMLACQCLAQDIKRITKDSLQYQEKFDVLKANPAVKQGYYELFVRSSKKMLSNGYYKNNKKDGVWHVFDDNGHVIVEGRYSNGQKTGEWKYYEDLWHLANTYDFTKKELVYHLPTLVDSTTRFKVLIKPRDTLVTLLNRAPVYLGGDFLIARTLVANLASPPGAVQAHIAGKTIVSFTVEEGGHIRDYHITHSLRPDCDQAALTAVKMIPDNWVPGRYQGKDVAVVISLAVAFDFRKK